MAVVLPDDLQSFLRRREQLQYDTSLCEPGQIELLPLDQITLGEVWVEPRWKSDPQGDPHAGEKGYYFLPAVNLVSEAVGYKPAFILLWLPNEQLYGTWDDEHYKLFVFPGVTWTDIVTPGRIWKLSGKDRNLGSSLSPTRPICFGRVHFAGNRDASRSRCSRVCSSDNSKRRPDGPFLPRRQKTPTK